MTNDIPYNIERGYASRGILSNSIRRERLGYDELLARGYGGSETKRSRLYETWLIYEVIMDQEIRCIPDEIERSVGLGRETSKYQIGGERLGCERQLARRLGA